jgi:glycerophosphoryl diester phosphodiesterase
MLKNRADMFFRTINVQRVLVQIVESSNKELASLQVQTLQKVIEHFGKNKNYYIETKSPEVYPGMEENLFI